MIVVDVNLFVYAYNERSEQHARARRWLQSALAGSLPVGLPWAVIHGFLRLVTDGRIVGKPLPLTAAIAIVDTWRGEPRVRIIEPGPRYWSLLRELAQRVPVAGALVSDAHLAALAMEHDATFYTTDRDFRRFTGLRVINPLAS